MKVAELRAILEHVPDDLDVVVSSPGGTCSHVTEVSHSTTYRRMTTYLGTDRELVLPSVLHIEAERAPRWYEPSCDFTLTGFFQGRAELEHKLGDLP